MSNLKNLLTRINSVKSTKKITKVMQMIAASKLRATQHERHSAKLFAEQISDSVSRLLAINDNINNISSSNNNSNNSSQSAKISNATNDNKNNDDLLAEQQSNVKQPEKEIIIIISSNRGLCGGYNASLVKLVQHKILSFTNKQNKHFIFFGKKAYDALKGKIPEGDRWLFTQKTSFTNIKALLDQAYSSFKVKSFHILYTKFKSALAMTPAIEQIFPVQNSLMPSSDSDSGQKLLNTILNANFNFEPSYAVILAEFIKKYQYAKLYSALKEATVSEYMSRVIAMEGATKNAQNVIDNLSRQYNRSRQDKITKELIEIISGAEAL